MFLDFVTKYAYFLHEIICNICVKNFLRSFVFLFNVENVLPLLARKLWGVGAIGKQHCWSIVLRSIAANTTDFIPPTLRPLKSLDLNLVDYKVWSVIYEQVYQAPIHDVKNLKQRLLDVWATASENYRLFCQSKFWQIKFKYSYLFICWAKCYGVLDSYSSFNSLTIWKVLEWYDQE